MEKQSREIEHQLGLHTYASPHIHDHRHVKIDVIIFFSPFVVSTGDQNQGLAHTSTELHPQPDLNTKE